MKYRISSLLAAATFAVTLSFSFFAAEAQELKEGVQVNICESFMLDIVIEGMAADASVSLIHRFMDEEASNFLSLSYEGGSDVETNLVLVYNKDDNSSLHASAFLNDCAVVSSLWPASAYNKAMKGMGISSRKTVSDNGPWPMYEAESD